MHLPVSAKEHLHICVREKIRRTMRPIKNGDVRVMLVDRNHRDWQAGHGCCHGVGADVQHVACAQGTPGMASELTEREGGAAAKVQRHIQPTAQRQVRARTCALHGTQLQHTASLEGVRLPQGQHHTVHTRRHGRTAEGDHRVVQKTQAGAGQRAFQRRSMGFIANQAVCQAHGQIVHRTAGGHAYRPVTNAAWVVLHGGLHAWLQHLQRLRLVVVFGQAARDHQALHEHRVGHYGAQITQIGLYSRQTRGSQGVLQLGHGIGPIGAGDDEFGDHWIVVRRHFTAGGNPGLNAGTRGENHLCQPARARLKVTCRILGVKSNLNRGALWLGHMQGKVIPARQAQHPGHQIDAGDLLGHAMLYLQAGVDFEKIKVTGVGVQHVLHCACRAVVHGLGQTDSGLLQSDASHLRQAGGGGFFNHLLVAALCRAVPLTQRHHLTPAITKKLHFNVARPLDEFFQKKARVFEVDLRQTLYGDERRSHLSLAADQAHADAAAPRSAFEHHWIANALCLAVRLH